MLRVQPPQRKCDFCGGGEQFEKADFKNLCFANLNNPVALNQANGARKPEEE